MVTTELEYYKVYEELLLGNIKGFPVGFFKISEEADKEHAKELFRYAFEDLLGWSPEVCCQAIDEDIIKTMKLHNLMKYMGIPTGYEKRINPKFYAHIVYPNKVKFTWDELDICIYKEVAAGKVGYPKKFFQEETGYQRAIACLLYVLQRKQTFSCVKDIYDLFLKNGVPFLKEHKLVLALDLFETPIDYVHETLAEDQKDEFLFNYYKFAYLYKQKKREINRKKSTEDTDEE